MAPSINNPGGLKNDPDEIRDGVVSDGTRFPGGFIDQQITEAGAAVQIQGRFILDNASFAQSFDIRSQDTSPTGLDLKPDGSQLYVLGSTNDNVYQYGLSTAYDISTASFTQSFDVSGQDTSPTGLDFKPDGSRLYVIGDGNNNVYQYSLSTAYDISTASFTQSFDVGTQDGSPLAVVFKPDGTQMYFSGLENDNVYQYSLSTAYDISTASFVRSFDVSGQDTRPTGLDFQPDGRRMYVLGNRFDNVYQYSLSTAFDISTASFIQSLDISPQDVNAKGVVFKSDGSQLYIVGNSNFNVYQYGVGFVGSLLG